MLQTDAEISSHPLPKKSEIAAPDIPVGLAMTHRELPQKYRASFILSLSKDDMIMIHPSPKDSEIATAFAMLKLRNDALGVSPLTSSNHLSTELRH